MTAAPYPANILSAALSASGDNTDSVNTTAEEVTIKCNVSKDSSPDAVVSAASLAQETDELTESGSCIHTDFILPRCTLPPRQELEPIMTFVANAVQEQHNQPNDHSPVVPNYKGIVDAIRTKNDRKMLHSLLIALRTAGSGSTLHLLTSQSNRHARLIHQIVRMNPFDLVDNDSYDICDAQLHLLMAIVSANSLFLVQTMTSVWRLLTHQVEEMPLERSQRLHAAMATILRLCPKGKTELFPIILSNSPFRMRPGGELEWYYRQCLEVLRYHPSIQPLVLELIVDKCLEMDVEIKINDGGEVSFDNNKDDDDIFQLDLNDQSKKALPAGISVDEMADKLDSLMSLLFHYTETVTTGTTPHSALYQVFARVFESSIVITHKSKFVQFVLLHVCGLQSRESLSDSNDEPSPSLLYRDFAAKLIEIIVDPFRATVTRQAGACYLASFISRSLFVCDETVCESISALLRCAGTYIESLESVHSTDPVELCRVHSLFYTVCQSAFYIMCFRGVDAINYYRDAKSNSDSTDMELIDISATLWNMVCGHTLQPLKFCLESVRIEFVQIAKMCRLLDVGLLELLERDDRVGSSRQPRERKRCRIMTPAMLEKERLSGGVGGLGRGTNPLDSYFPFDPYLLSRSQAYIEPFYRHWPGSVEETLLEDDPVNDDVEEEDDASVQSSDSGDSAGDSSQDEAQKETFISTATTVDTTPDVLTKRAQLREVWTDTLKRARAPSMENGSW